MSYATPSDWASPYPSDYLLPSLPAEGKGYPLSKCLCIPGVHVCSAILEAGDATSHPTWATPHPNWTKPHPFWAMPNPKWATLHPNWASPHPSNTTCYWASQYAILEAGEATSCPTWATPHPNWATPHPPTELLQTLTELRCTLTELCDTLLNTTCYWARVTRYLSICVHTWRPCLWRNTWGRPRSCTRWGGPAPPATGASGSDPSDRERRGVKRRAGQTKKLCGCSNTED